MGALASAPGTAAYARARDADAAHWRAWRGLTLSSLGFGSYLGDDTDEADDHYTEAFRIGLAGGVNVLDTAANYRGRRSERAIGRALREAGVPRAQYLVATKGGFVPDAQTARAFAHDLVAGCHVMTPEYVARELDASLEALGLDAVDVWFLHNPETQLAAGVPRDAFEARLRACFATLEEERREGRVGVYGLATWQGLRVPPSAPAHLPLERILDLAREVGGADHGLRALELPYNLAMPEAARAPTQRWRGRDVPLLAAARDADMLVLGSATLMQGRLLRQMPQSVRDRLGRTAAEAAIQFSRSTPGIASALVGTGRPEHARENLAVLRAPPRTDAAAALLGG